MSEMSALDKRELIRKAAEKNGNLTLRDELIEHVQEELADNLGVSQDGLPWYGIGKVAMYSAQVSAAIARGINPAVLRYSGVVTDEEVGRAYERLADLDIVPGEV